MDKGIFGDIDVTDYTVDGRCSGCGACCSDYLPLSEGEVTRIHRYIIEHGLREHKALVTMGATFDMTCPFRDNVNKRCDIYDIRPEICRCFQCNQSVDVISANKAMYHRKNRVVSMRGEFFGDVAGRWMAMQLAARMRKAGVKV